jgi:hypothetical protein
MSERTALRQLRRALAWLLLAAAVLWLALRILVLHDVRTALSDFEARHGELSAEALIRPAPPDWKNGATFYDAAGRLVDLDDEAWQPLYRSLRAEGPLEIDRSLRDGASHLAERNRLALELFREGSRQSACQFVTEMPNAMTAISPTLALLRLSQLEMILGHPDFAGDAAERARSIESVLRLARCLQLEGAIIYQLMGGAIERTALREMRRDLQVGAARSGLAALASILPQDSEIPTVSESLRIDLLAMYPSEPTVLTDPGVRYEGPFWSPLSVQGFGWATALRTQDLVIRAVEGESGAVPHDRWSPTRRVARVVAKIAVPDLSAWKEKRRKQMALRLLARRALVTAESSTPPRLAPDVPTLSSEEVKAGMILEPLSNGGIRLSLREDLLGVRAPETSTEGLRDPFAPLWSWTLPPPKPR